MSEIQIQKGKIVRGEEEFFEVKLLSGEGKGELIKAKNDQRFEIKEKNYKVGDKVTLYSEALDSGEKAYSISNYRFLDSILIWTFLFFATVLLVGRKAGVKALLSLIFSLALIFLVFLPLVLEGFSPIFTSLAVSFFITLISILLISGNSKKSWVAIFSTFFGVVCAFVFAYFAGLLSGIDGTGSEEVRNFAVSFGDSFDLNGIFLAGIIIGALGAVVDTTISIASGMNEIKEHKRKITFKELWISGENIGKDVLGGMVNTLVFAYIGSSLVLVLMAFLSGVSLSEFLNFPFIAEEVLRSLAGSIGLVLSIPFTALLGAWVFRK